MSADHAASFLLDSSSRAKPGAPWLNQSQSLESIRANQRLIFLKFTVSVSPATIPGLPPVTALGEGVPCLHLLLDLRIRKKSGELGTIRPYFHAAAPMHRSIVQTGVVGVDTFEGESDEQSIGRSGSLRTYSHLQKSEARVIA